MVGLVFAFSGFERACTSVDRLRKLNLRVFFLLLCLLFFCYLCRSKDILSIGYC